MFQKIEICPRLWNSCLSRRKSAALKRSTHGKRTSIQEPLRHAVLGVPGGGCSSSSWKRRFWFWYKTIMFFNRNHYFPNIFVLFFACCWTAILPHRLCSPFCLSPQPYSTRYKFYHAAGRHAQIHFYCKHYHDTPNKKNWAFLSMYFLYCYWETLFFEEMTGILTFIAFPAPASMCIRHICSIFTAYKYINLYRKVRRQFCTLTGALCWTGCLRLGFQRSLCRLNIKTPL